jgi:hypothetical protein
MTILGDGQNAGASPSWFPREKTHYWPTMRKGVMIEYQTAGAVRLIGLLGLALSVVVWAIAERSGNRKTLLFASSCAAFLSALIYFLGVMADAQPGATCFLPHFP